MAKPLLRLSKGFWGLVISATVFLCGFTVTGFLGGAWYAFDLTANFRVQYLGCLVVAAILFLLGQKWTWAVVCVAFALVNLVEILPAFTGRGKPQSTASGRVRLLLANVLSSNKDYGRMQELIRTEQPDVVGIIEASSGWMEALSVFEETYPHVVSRPREDNFGIALLSRFPFEKSEIIEVGDAMVPSAMARIRSNDREFTIVATHPPHPVRRSGFKYRNRQLEAAAEYVRSLEGPVILCGDLNTTPWSPFFKKLLRQSGLRDSRRGRGIQPTWPGQARLPLLRIPLDHVLRSPDVAILRRKIGPDIGSDHLPVIVEFSLSETRKRLGQP